MLKLGIQHQPRVEAKQTCSSCGVAKSTDQFARKDGGKRISKICDACKPH